MKTLTIRFISEPGIISKLIEWQTNSLWCHTEVLNRDATGWIGAHSDKGVECRPLDWCQPTRESRYAVLVSDSEYQTAMSWVESKVGCPYNFCDIVGLLIHKRTGSSDHEIICSALMTEMMIKANRPPLNCLEGFSYLITPEILHLSTLFIGKRVYNRVSK